MFNCDGVYSMIVAYIVDVLLLHILFLLYDLIHMQGYYVCVWISVLLWIYFSMRIWHLNHHRINIIEKECNSLEIHNMVIIGVDEYVHKYIDLSGYLWWVVQIFQKFGICGVSWRDLECLRGHDEVALRELH